MSSTRKAPFLDQVTMEKASRALSEEARDQGIDAMVIGGFAMQHYGSDRLTADVDFAASEVLPGYKSTGRLSFGGVKFTGPEHVPIDWVVRSDDFAELYEEALSRSRRMQGYRLVTPDYLAALKLASGRAKDIDDLLFLLREGKVDPKKVSKIVYRLVGGQFARQEFQRLVDEAEWRKRRDE